VGEAARQAASTGNVQAADVVMESLLTLPVSATQATLHNVYKGLSVAEQEEKDRQCRGSTGCTY